MHHLCELNNLASAEQTQIGTIYSWLVFAEYRYVRDLKKFKFYTELFNLCCQPPVY